MYEEAFQKLEKDEAEKILQTAAPFIDGVSFDMSHVTILRQDLSFYPNHVFYDIADLSAAKAIHRYVVMKDNVVTVLNWTSAIIYGLNKTAPLTLNDENIGDYVRFFFSYVRGAEGKFSLAENVDDVAWKDDPSPSSRKAVGNMITPLTLLQVHDDGGYDLEGTITFKNALFKAEINIAADGALNITNQELLLEDLPVFDDIFGQ